MTGFFMVVPVCEKCGKSKKSRIVVRDGVWDTEWVCSRRHPKASR